MICLPWCKNRVVQEVFKDFSVGGVGSFSLQVLHWFGTGATGTFICPVWIWFCRLGVLFLVSHTNGSDSDRDLQLWREKKECISWLCKQLAVKSHASGVCVHFDACFLYLWSSSCADKALCLQPVAAIGPGSKSGFHLARWGETNAPPAALRSWSTLVHPEALRALWETQKKEALSHFVPAS